MYEKILNLTRDWKKSTTLRLFFLSQDYQKYLKVPPWLVWLSGLSTSLQTKGSPVRFPVRAHAWVVGQVPSRGRLRGNHTLMLLSLVDISLPLFLLPFRSLKKLKKKKKKS